MAYESRLAGAVEVEATVRTRTLLHLEESLCLITVVPPVWMETGII